MSSWGAWRSHQGPVHYGLISGKSLGSQRHVNELRGRKVSVPATFSPVATTFSAVTKTLPNTEGPQDFSRLRKPCAMRGWRKPQPLPGHRRPCQLLRPQVDLNLARDALALPPTLDTHRRLSTTTLKAQRCLIVSLTVVPLLEGQVTNAPQLPEPPSCPTAASGGREGDAKMMPVASRRKHACNPHASDDHYEASVLIPNCR